MQKLRHGHDAYERVYAICRAAHERCVAVEKQDLLRVVDASDYDACLVVEQQVYADLCLQTRRCTSGPV